MHIHCQEQMQIQMLTTKIRMALKKVQKMKFRKRRNRENLKNKSEEFADTVDSKLVQVRSGLEEKLEDYWQRFKKCH